MIKQIFNVVKISTSLFRFYYYVLTKNDKKYEIAMDRVQSFVATFLPIISLILIYPIMSAAFLPAGFEFIAFLFIPLVVGNLFFILSTSNKFYEIKWAKERERMKKEQEELDEILKKHKRMQEEKRRIEQEEFERMFRQWEKQEAAKKIDQNKVNAIKLMGLSDIPTPEEVKKAYRKLSKKHHPDAGGTHENFIKLNKAYEYLMNRI